MHDALGGTARSVSNGELCQAWPNSPGANMSPVEAIANDRPRVLGGGWEDGINATDVAGTMP
jgi:hypothetical protein